jgi:hypothetical protein
MPTPNTIPITPGTGQNLDSLQVSTSAGTVSREVVTIGDASTGANVAAVSSVGAVSTNLTQVAGSSVIAIATGIQAVGTLGHNGLSFDNPSGSAPPSSALWIGYKVSGVDFEGVSLSNPLPENIAQIAGSTVTTAATGVQQVGVVGNAGAAFDAATAAPVPANAIQQGVRAATAYPTAVTNGQLVGAMSDKAGRAAVVLNSPRDLVGTAALTSASGSATSFIAAGAANVFNDIVSLVITNSTATATTVTLSDNGSGGNTYLFDLAGNGGIVMNFPTPLPQGTAAAAWDVLNSAAVSLHYTCIFIKNK